MGPRLANAIGRRERIVELMALARAAKASNTLR